MEHKFDDGILAGFVKHIEPIARQLFKNHMFSVTDVSFSWHRSEVEATANLSFKGNKPKKTNKQPQETEIQPESENWPEHLVELERKKRALAPERRNFQESGKNQ